MKTKSFFSISLALALAVLLVIPASAFFTPSNGQAATLVLGQPDFTSGGSSLTQSGMNAPEGVAVDPTSGKVFVADTSNNRVLRFADAAALINGAAAEVTLGMPDYVPMRAPADVAVDANGRLWVADTFNHRILRYDNAANKGPGDDADGVLGQPDFMSTGGNTTQSGMTNPFGVAVDASGRLWVADASNNRVLRFDNAAAKADGANADGVLGQPDFTTSTGAPAMQNNFLSPDDLVVDGSGRLWVADFENNRVLRFDNAASLPNGADENGVLGQPDFTSHAGHTNQIGMFGPRYVAVDASGRLYVSDTGNSRILVFSAAAKLANGAKASNVLGQPNFTSPGSGLSATSLFHPYGIFYDPAVNVLWAADSSNNRVLMYGSPDIRILPIFGLINFFLPPGTINTGRISIQTRDGSIRTFDLARDVKIRPAARASQLGIGSYVTVIARLDPYTHKWVGSQIIVLSIGSGATFTPTVTSLPTEPPTATITPTSTPTLPLVPTDTPTKTPVGIPTSVPTDTPTETPVGIPTFAP